MLAACEAGDVFALLEGGGARDAADALYGAAREPWLTRALLHYHARTGSSRAIEVLARAPDHHARHLLDALQEQLRADAEPRRAALAALAPLVARRPAWLARPPAAPALARDLLRAARTEREPLPLLHALLALAALLPAAPALAAPLAPELADALLRPAALDPPPSALQRAHLQLAQLALFHALYATHPCTLLDALRSELSAAAGARDAWERGLAPLLRSVRLHPALVSGSRQREADAARWARVELHDVLAESRRLALPARERAASPAIAPPPTPPAPASPAPGSGAAAALAAQTLRPGAEPWFALAERCGADSAPHTPLPADADAAEPPEAAVEATPENTPAKDTPAQFRFPAESGAVRAIGRRSPPSGVGGIGAGGAETPVPRLARVLAERRAAESPVPFAAPPPSGVARPEPSRPAPAAPPEPEPADGADREVGELTARALPEDAWPEVEASAGERAAALDPRRGPLAPEARPPPPARAGPSPRAARRASSCSPMRASVRSAGVQTLHTWPSPYEFLIGDFYRGLPEEPRPQAGERDPALPCERLDAYLAELYAGRAGAGPEAAEQLRLVHAQLMYERWRREAHAERNRRLLGRCRQARALELQNAALRDRLRQAARDHDELRAALGRERPPAAPGPAPPEREARLEAALHAEREARARAEAALHEAERARACDAAELQRTRGESFEAARHVEALARAALAAERRAEHVRRLRRELLVLAERETRLGEAARAAAASGAAGHADRAAAEERALRAACARAEADSAAATARADAAAARAHELEASLAARDAVVAELKRATRHAAEEHAAELRAMRDKYEALMRVVRAAEARSLERLAGAPGPRAPPAPRPLDGVEGAGAPRPRRPLEHDAEPSPADG